MKKEGADGKESKGRRKMRKEKEGEERRIGRKWRVKEVE